MRKTLVLAMPLVVLVAAASRAEEVDGGRWCSRVVEDVDWVAWAPDWSAADALAGGLLSFIVPVPELIGQAPPAGEPVLIATKRSAEGPDKLLVLVRPGAVAPGVEAAKALEGFVAFGALDLLRPDGDTEAPPHPLFFLVQALPETPMLGIGATPVVLDRTPPGPFVEVLSETGRFAAGLSTRKSKEGVDVAVLSFLVPMDPMLAGKRAAALRSAATAYVDGAIERLSDTEQATRGNLFLWMDLAAKLGLWEQWADEKARQGLAGAITLPIAEVPAFLAGGLSFPTPKAAVDAWTFSHGNRAWAVHLATLSPRLRLSGLRGGSLTPARLAASGARHFYRVEKAYEEEDRAQYRVRIDDEQGTKTLEDLHLDLFRDGGVWWIDDIGPYRSSGGR